MKKTFLFLITLLAIFILVLCTAALADTLTLPAELTAVEDQAFFGDQSLGTVVLPEHLETIGSKAFAGSGVTAVNLPDSLTFIADDAFDNTSITTLTVKEGTYAYNWAVNHGYFGWEYDELLDGTLEIIGFTHEESDVIIPRQIGGKQVSSIADTAFAGKQGFVNVTVPGTITRIGYAAFAGIGTLKTVTVCQGVKIIDNEAFTDCPNLITATLPESGVTLGGAVFRYCGSLTTVTLPAVTEVPANLFYDCKSLESIVIPEGVLSISSNVFWNCESLQSVTLPDSLTFIGKQAFHACTSLQSITIPANVTEIHETAFNDCEWLVMYAPEGSYAADYAVEHDLVPEPVVIESAHPATGKTTYTYVHPDEAVGLLVTFSGKTYINGPWDMDYLLITDGEGNGQEYTGDSLSGVTLLLGGNSFTIFQNCLYYGSDFGFRITSVQGLNQEEYDAYNAELEANPWISHIVNGTLEITGYRGHATDLTVPAHINNVPVRSIGEEAFKGNKNLISVTAEEGIAVIGKDAFSFCDNLREINLPDTVQEIGPSAFARDTALLSLDFPEGITELNECVLMSCTSLQHVTIPESVTSIDNSALNTCLALKEIDLPAGLTYLGPRAFVDSGLTSLVLPEGITEVPLNLCKGCKDLSTVTLPDGLVSIEEGAFAECKSLAQVDLPASLKAIGTYAFADSGLAEITLPQGMETIGDDAFSGTLLTHITIPASVTSMSPGVFFSCRNLTEIVLEGDSLDFTIRDGFFLDKEEGTTLLSTVPGLQGTLQVPDYVRHINSSALGGLKHVTEIIVPETVESMGKYPFDKSLMTRIEIRAPITVLPEYCFNDCQNLTDIVLPETLEDIDMLAFNKCGVRELTFPSSLRSVGAAAIMGCNNLETVIFPEHVETLSMMAIADCPNLTYVYIPASVTTIGMNTLENCPNAVVHTPAGSYAATWAAGQGIPVVTE